MRLSKVEFEGDYSGDTLSDPDYRLTLHDGYVSACRDGRTTLYPLGRMREAVVYSEADMVLLGPAEMVEPEPFAPMPDPADELPQGDGHWAEVLHNIRDARASGLAQVDAVERADDAHCAAIVRKRGELFPPHVPVPKLRTLITSWRGDDHHNCDDELEALIDETEVGE